MVGELWKAMPCPSSSLAVRSLRGVVTAVVAVTGVVDHVQDLIVLGAFARTLRVPRGLPEAPEMGLAAMLRRGA